MVVTYCLVLTIQDPAAFLGLKKNREFPAGLLPLYASSAAFMQEALGVLYMLPSTTGLNCGIPLVYSKITL